jgi:hypothetical protein
MASINSIFRLVFDALLGPFKAMPAMVTLVPISAVVTVLALLVFKWTSNQEALDRVKAQIHAGIFEIRLFNDDMRAIFRAQADILVQVGKQLALTLVPLLWMLIPFAIIIPQLQFHYGYQGLEQGQSVLLKMTLAGEGSADLENPGFEIEAPAGVELETEAIWVPLKNEVLWRLSGSQPGIHELAISNGSFSTTKRVVVSDDIVRRSPFKVSGFWSQIAFPAEAPLPADAPVAEISLPYEDAEVSLFGWSTHWLIAFLVLTVVFAFALRGPMGVTF